MDKETWLLWLLADSQLPTGGFVASAGLEAAMQAGLVRDGALEDDIGSFLSFIRDSTRNQARLALPFCSRAHSMALDHIQRISLETSEEGERSAINAALADFSCVDSYHQSMLSSNKVAMRASIAQGGGLLMLFNRGYAQAGFMSGRRGILCAAMAKQLQRLSRLGETQAHWPTIFGFVCATMDISKSHMQQLFLFQFVRQLFSAAVRLNLVGPLRAQTLQCDMQPFVSSLLEQWSHVEVSMGSIEDVFGESAVYTEPILELYQGMHDRLYSRIFNS
ncbi:hypothetical protein IW140_003554 [Coemansia sp. RSA 1813]|nr:hypothetical protein EV178_003479 [Coemansia sp. RSA 1646]KAJ1769159.1 hypothetical protein LPJ74_004275 [Coemansia sp. RSA 1843]KAJ2089136.1 hypothetical protein IW138_003716 [Coemansia sp. RSA 986]KAJ2215607.1 hypothetical protein EV179_002018 [Coemansia sp. RSA 487]KAJ2568797.1 hypothetical protein IW140_003554 [Coemansia sp. RSA 1813]